MSTHKLGRLPNDPSKPRLAFGKFLKDTADYPSSRDWLSNVSDWPMYLNDQIGDCTCAGAGHIIESASTYGQGATVKVTDNDILTAYVANSGYDPKTGANDNGAVMQDVLNYWRKTGIAGHKILAFGELNIKDKDQLYKSLNVFGTLYLGINFPESAMDQFDAGQPWDVVKGAKIEGGHAINAGFYDVDAKVWKVVTWGKVQTMTQAFFDKYVEEAWAVITPEWFNTTGVDPTGLDLYNLGQDLQELTGEANPFPAPQPSPTPVPPAPTPTPSPEPVPAPVEDNVVDEIKKLFQKLKTLIEKL